MQGVNASLFARMEFEVYDASLYDVLTLRMKYDDGFVAYLNGTEVARRNAPDPLDPLQYDSAATAAHADAAAVVFEDIDISDYLASLHVGTNVLAIHGLNVSAGDGDFLIVPEIIARSNLGSQQYMTSPTAGTGNLNGAIGFVGDTKFSVDRGFFDAPFSVEITTDSAQAQIRYTLDGSAPTATTGILYTGPVSVDTTTVLRAAAFRAGYMPSGVDTQTYIFLDDVLNQPASPAGYPAMWRAEPADYEMDPEIVGNPLYSATLLDDLKSLPTMSLVMNVDDLFGNNGIYANPNNQGVAWERPGSLEMFYPDGSVEGFQIDAGIRMYGGVGRDPQFKKHTFRVFFKDMYGASKLRYPLFGEEAADKFDTIILRSNFNDAWVWGGARSQFIRDEFISRLQLAMGDPAKHGNFVHLYINGLYWGLYNPEERPDTSFSATYIGGEKEDWDGINSNAPTGGGSRVAWDALMDMADAGLTSNDAYQMVQGNNPDGTDNPAYEDYLDIDNYIDYLLLNFWGGNNDWVTHNWYAGRLRGPQSTGWKSYSWDAEWTVDMNSGLTDSSVDDNAVGDYLIKPYWTLRYNPEFQLRFADRVQKQMFNGGPLTPEYTGALYQSMADLIDGAVVAESARWGDAVTTTPFTLQNWTAERNYIVNTYLPQRTAIVLGQLKTANLYPSVDAPRFQVNGVDQHGGELAPGDQLTVASAVGHDLLHDRRERSAAVRRGGLAQCRGLCRRRADRIERILVGQVASP